MQNYFFPKALNIALYSVGIGIIFLILDLEFFASLSFLFAFLTLVLFRKKEINHYHSQEDELLSVASGKVHAIKESDKEKYKSFIEIESSFFDNAGFVYPAKDAKIISKSLIRGTRLAKDSSLFGKLNEMLSIEFEINGNHILIEHRVKQSPFGITLCHIPSQSFYGYGVYCSTRIYLPQNFTLTVALDQKVESYTNQLGYFSKE